VSPLVFSALCGTAFIALPMSAIYAPPRINRIKAGYGLARNKFLQIQSLNEENGISIQSLITGKKGFSQACQV
jgi:hypothetical protein